MLILADPQMRKRPNPNVWDAENFSRSPQSSMPMEHEILDSTRSGQGGNPDRANYHGGGFPSHSSTGRHQDHAGLSGSGEAEDPGVSKATGQSTQGHGEDGSNSLNVFEAIGRWADAVKIMSKSLDR